MVRCGIHFHTVGLENNFAWRVDEGHFLNLFNVMCTFDAGIFIMWIFLPILLKKKRKKRRLGHLSAIFFQYNNLEF